jgi:hypothetical protein
MTDAKYSWPNEVAVERSLRIERQLLHRVAMQRCSPEVNAQWARHARARAAAGRAAAQSVWRVSPIGW